MKDLKLTVVINRPIEAVFDFTTNPENTARWINSIEKEETNTKEVTIGTLYCNWSKKGDMNEYVVTKFDRPKVFQLDATHADYKVRYTYTELAEARTELEYFEWSESDQLHAPFMQEILDSLKAVMESDDHTEV